MPAFDLFPGSPVPGTTQGRILNPKQASRSIAMGAVPGAPESIVSAILSSVANAKAFLQGTAVLIATAPATTQAITRTGGTIPAAQLNGMSWNDVIFAVRTSTYSVA